MVLVEEVAPVGLPEGHGSGRSAEGRWELLEGLSEPIKAVGGGMQGRIARRIRTRVVPPRCTEVCRKAIKDMQGHTAYRIRTRASH